VGQHDHAGEDLYLEYQRWETHSTAVNTPVTVQSFELRLGHEFGPVVEGALTFSVSRESG